MAIQCNYDFNGILIPNAYIRVDRVTGSSKEGWNSLVGVYNVVGDEKKLITQFNKSTSYSENERGYVSLYNALKADYAESVDC